MQTPQLRPPPPPAAVEVDEAVWRAVAGASVKIPGVNSYVYYFPQGHLEHCSTADNYNFTTMRPWIPCQVISVRFLSDPVSDQAFASILLHPMQPLGPRPVSDAIDGAEDDDVVSFAKILTRSDANNGGGFSVPRFCADMILPQLNFAADPPVQNLVLTDTLNNAWEFRHIYRGTPRRHLLTTGWSKYVNAKKLVAGDSVVFMRKKSTNELFIGVRRAENFGGDGGGNGDEAVAAIEKALRGIPFEAVYYPKVGVADFVVQAEKVKEAMRIRWSPGMRVRMAVETDDSSRMTWIQGVVTTVAPAATGRWCGSPWRMLQVNWDDPEISQNIKKVSPWQVEYLPLSPLIDTEFPPSKRLKLLQDSGMLIPNDFQMKELSHSSNFSPIEFSHSSMAGLMNSALLNYSPFPAGMQGARRVDHTLNNSFSTTFTTPTAAANGGPDPPRKEAELNGGGVSTVLSIGNSNSDKVSSSDSQSGVQSGGGGGQPSSSSSFQLFGRTIQTAAAAAAAGNGEGGWKCNESCRCGGKGCCNG